KVLEGALSLAGADRGSLQLVTPAGGELLIVAQHGFGSEFLEHFAVVEDDHSACGRVAKRRAQTVIADVMTDPGFAPHRAIAAASGFRAVLSTPLIDRDGRLIGVVSAHYRRPYCPTERDRQVMQRYGELAGWVVAEHLAGSPAGRAGIWTGAVAAALHRAARAHAAASEAHERSVRARVGDMAEHQRLAEFHRVAAEADRQRAEEAESRAVAPRWTVAERFEAMMLESHALRQISEEARARARATREQIYQGRSRRAVLHDSAYARLQARMETMPVIEQAKGIVMVRQECGAEEAFDLLRRISQRTGVKVHVLAAQIVKQVATGGHRGDVMPLPLGALRFLPSGTRAEPAAAEADNPRSRVTR
ncbi:MAG: GAF and ANTAR domain-containing protein, partial [Actinobacteria bacterium]|nr:GAF and ANTAR domain-containing protein [Actinomycetota bacterium]